MTSLHWKQTKSTIWGPIGACRRKLNPSAFSSRNFIHSLTSCGVRRLRSARAISFARIVPCSLLYRLQPDLSNLTREHPHPTRLRPATLPTRGRDVAGVLALSSNERERHISGRRVAHPGYAVVAAWPAQARSERSPPCFPAQDDAASFCAGSAACMVKPS